MIYAVAALAIVLLCASGFVRNRRLRLGALAALAVLVLLAPAIVGNDATVDALSNIGIYIILALGLNITVGFAGLLDLGYAAFFAIGAYAYAILASDTTATWGVGLSSGLHVPFWAMLIIGPAIAALFGLVLGAPTLRLYGDYLAIVTLGFGQIVPQVIQNLTKYTGGPNGINALDVPSFFGRSFGQSATPYFYCIVAAIALVVWLVFNMQHSRLGRAWMAMREDALAARHAGVNTTAVKLAAFACGAAVAGLAGVLFAAKLSAVSPDSFQFQVSVLILSMVVLGGMGNMSGVAVGAIVLALVNNTVLPQVNTLVNGALHSNFDLTKFNFFIYGAILVALMLFRPEGVLPNRELRAELHAGEAAQ